MAVAPDDDAGTRSFLIAIIFAPVGDAARYASIAGRQAFFADSVSRGEPKNPSSRLSRPEHQRNVGGYGSDGHRRRCPAGFIDAGYRLDAPRNGMGGTWWRDGRCAVVAAAGCFGRGRRDGKRIRQ